MVIGPTYPTLRDSTLKSFLNIARDLGVITQDNIKLSPPPEIRLNNGAEILFRSADTPDRLRGPNLSGVWMDEASLMSREAYDISIGRLREAGERGWLSATFTPKGPSHWTFEVFGSGRPDTVMFRARTKANPFLAKSFVAGLEQQYGDTNWARQELEGEFVQLEGAEFPGEWFLGDDLWFDVWPPEPYLKVIALDPSKGSDGKGEDYQAHTMVSVAVQDGKYMFYVDADLQREGVVPMCERTVLLTREFGKAGSLRPVDSVIVEENGTLGLLPPALDAACAKHGFPVPYLCRTNRDQKEFRIRYWLAPPLSRRQIRFKRTPGARLLVGQAQSFPFSEHDDGIDSLATALRRVSEMLQ